MTDVPTVFFIDDNPSLRGAFERNLRARWQAQGREELPRTATHRFVWQLFRDKKARPGDIAICDLYPSGYWGLVPAPRRRPPVPNLPDDPRNVRLAIHDVVNRFLVPLKRKRALRIVLYSYVPPWFDEEGFPELADEIREFLASVGLEMIEKTDRSDDPENLGAVMERVDQLLAQAKAEGDHAH